METKNVTELICKAIHDKKGFQIQILDVTHLTTVADYFVLASGRSTTQVKAISDNVQEKLEKNGIPLVREEGYREGRWIAMDYGHIIVHIFNEETREFYQLERLWTDGANVVTYEPPKRQPRVKKEETKA